MIFHRKGALLKEVKTLNLKETPYQERKFLIVDSPTKKSASEAVSDAIKETLGEDTVRILDKVGCLIIPGYELSMKVRQLLNEIAAKVKQKLGHPLLILPLQHAEIINFPPGHPNIDTIYVGHPIRENHYYPLAAFNHAIHEDKANELIKILTALKAKHICVYHKRTEAELVKANISLQAEIASASINASASNSTEIYYKGEFEPSCALSKQQVNETLRKLEPLYWYKHEQPWQNIVDGLKNNGLKKVSYTLERLDQYSIDAKCVSFFQGLSLEIGGSFDEKKSVSWHIEAEF